MDFYVSEAPLFVSGKSLSWHIFVRYFVAVLLERKSTIRQLHVGAAIFLRQGLGAVGFTPRMISVQARLCSHYEQTMGQLPPCASTPIAFGDVLSRRITISGQGILGDSPAWSYVITRDSSCPAWT